MNYLQNWKNTAENTAIIQNVIDTAKDYEAIYVDGNYKITSLQLKDNTSIIINENCSLIGPTYEDGLNIEEIIWAKDATKISGEKWKKWKATEQLGKEGQYNSKNAF